MLGTPGREVPVVVLQHPYVPSYSKPTGTTSGWPSRPTVAIRASGWDFR